MATATGNYVHDNSTLANFQSWAGAIHSALISFGWLQTSDTGQTVPSAAASVPSSTYYYVIYKANDSLAATMPIYLKFAYGYNSTTVTFNMTVGTGSDGAGNITSPLTGSGWSPATQHSNSGSTTYPCFFSGDAGSFRMYMWQVFSSPSIPAFFSVSRSVNSSGVATNSYVTATFVDSNNNNQVGQQSFTSSAIGNSFQGLCTVYANTTIGSLNNTGYWVTTGTVEADPVFASGMGKAGDPMLDLMTCYAADAVDGNTVTVASAFGSTHTYLVCAGNNNFSRNIGQPINSAQARALLMRYE